MLLLLFSPPYVPFSPIRDYGRDAAPRATGRIAPKLAYGVTALARKYGRVAQPPLGDAMPTVPDFSAVAPTQIQTMFIDFGNDLPAGVTLVNTPSVILTRCGGNDPAPQSRLSGTPAIGTVSTANGGTGKPNTAILWRVAGCQDQTTYVVEVICDRSDGDRAERYTHFKSEAAH